MALCMPSATGEVRATVTSTNPAAARPRRYSDTDRAPGDAPGPLAPLGALLGGEMVVGDDVADPYPTARTEHPGHLAEDRRLVCRQVDHAIRDDDVDRPGRERDVLDPSQQEPGVVDGFGGSVAPSQFEHLRGHVETDGDAARCDPPRREDHVDTASRPEVEHGLPGRQVCHRSRVPAAEAHRRQCARLDVVVGAAGGSAATAGLAVEHLQCGTAVAVGNLFSWSISRRSIRQWCGPCPSPIRQRWGNTRGTAR